jgi:hypothetical protein
VHYYRNVGSASITAFELVTEDYLGLSALGLVRIRPLWTDLNLDGRPDFAWMASRGVNPTDSTLMQFLLNQSGPEQAYSFPSLQNRKRFPLAFNLYDCPLFTDVDGDQLPDMLLGKYNGKMQWWKRNAAWPDLSFQLQNANYGNIARAPFANGPCLAIADANQDGQADLISGDNSGVIKVYSNFLNQNPQQFVADSLLLYNQLLGTEIPSYGGSFLSPALADLNNDDFPELALGFAGGGMQLWVNRFGPNPVSGKQHGQLQPAWPNPVRAGERLRLGTREGEIQVWNSEGKKLLESRSEEDGSFLVPRHWQSGLYHIIKNQEGKSLFFRIQIWKQ